MDGDNGERGVYDASHGWGACQRTGVRFRGAGAELAGFSVGGAGERGVCDSGRGDADGHDDLEEHRPAMERSLQLLGRGDGEASGDGDRADGRIQHPPQFAQQEFLRRLRVSVDVGAAGEPGGGADGVRAGGAARRRAGRESLFGDGDSDGGDDSQRRGGVRGALPQRSHQPGRVRRAGAVLGRRGCDNEDESVSAYGGESARGGGDGGAFRAYVPVLGRGGRLRDYGGAFGRGSCGFFGGAGLGRQRRGGSYAFLPGGLRRGVFAEGSCEGERAHGQFGH